MNARKTNRVRRLAITPKPPRLILAALLAGGFAISSGVPAKNSQPVFAGLTVHEWGTFTSVAGADGQLMEWSPLTGSTARNARETPRRPTQCCAAATGSAKVMKCPPGSWTANSFMP